MANFEIKYYQVGPIQTNCYFMINADTKETIIVDPGDEPQKLINKLNDDQLKPVAILLTHGHYDHTTGVAGVKEAFDIPVYAHETEQEMLESVQGNPFSPTARAVSVKPDEYIHGEPEIELAGFKIKVLMTPGHTVGGVCYYFPDEKTLFSGDTLFCGSVGRTDFPGGSLSALVRSIKDKLFTLPDDVKVYPGHERTTSIGFEKQYNPFID